MNRRAGGWLSPLMFVTLCGNASDLQVLPSAAVARAALESSAQINVAREHRALGNVRAQQYSDGSHEWLIATTAQQREETASGIKYNEQLFTLSRAWRWPSKAGKDRALSERQREAADFGFEDAWHEAGRALLSGWFNWLRAESEARLLTEQTALYASQLAATRRRVQAGDAPRIEEQLAQAEAERAQVTQIKAHQAADANALLLRRDFPELELALPAALDSPPPPPQNRDDWIKRIVDHNHEIELAEAEAAVAKLAAERAGLDRFGDPTVGINYNRERGTQERVVGLSVSIPLPGAARQNAYDAAQAESRRSARLAEQTRLKVEHDARADVLAVDARHKQWQLLDALATQSRNNANVVARGYTLGEFNLTETLVARRQAAESALASQSAQLDALEARARLELDAHLLWTLDDEHDSNAQLDLR